MRTLAFMEEQQGARGDSPRAHKDATDTKSNREDGNEKGAKQREPGAGQGKPGLSAPQAYFKLWLFSSPIDTFARLAGTIAALAGGAALPLMAIVFGNFVNSFNGFATGTVSASRFVDDVNQNAVYLVYLWVGRFLLSYVGALLYNVTSSRIVRRIRMQYFGRVIRQPILYFDDHSVGSISTSLTTDVNAIELGLGEKISTVFQGSSMMITAFIIGLTKNWKLTLACLTVIPYNVIVTSVLATVDTKIERRIKSVYSEASTAVEEALSSVINITALGAVDKVVRQFTAFVHRASKHLAFRGVIWAGIYGNMFAAMHCVYALCLFYGVKLVQNGEIADGGTVLMQVYTGSSSMGLMAPSMPDVIKAAAAAQRIFTVLDEKNSLEDGHRPLRPLEADSVHGNLQLLGLTFAYPSRPSIDILSDVNLEFPANEVTAIVGPSGSGKSTIIAILERWYESKGKVLLDGVEMHEYEIRDWRGIIGLVQQEPVLFDDTILNNVLNGYHGGEAQGLDENERKELVIQACITANAHQFIQDLPDGYNTRVGEMAGQLSGGQKQRIAIARAIISDPKILLLDEATSALDSESEKAVQQALESASEGRTTVQITHNLSTIQHASKIVVLDSGRVLEEGTHATLMQNGGLYSRLLTAQRAAPEKGAVAPQQVVEAMDTGTFAAQKTRSGKDQETGTMSLARLDSPAIGRRYSILWAPYKLFKTYPHTRLPAITGTVAGMLIASSFPLMAFLFSKLVTIFQLQGQPNFVERGNFWALMFFIMAVGELIGYVTTFYLFGIAAVNMTRKSRPEYLGAILSQDPSYSEIQGHSSGVLMALMFLDAESLEMFISQNVPLLIVFGLDVIACSVLSIAMDWKLGLVSVLGALPVIVVSGLIRMRMDMNAQNRMQGFFLESARFASEAVGAIRTVTSLRLEDRSMRQYANRLTAAVARSAKQSLLYFVVFAISDSVDLLVMALIFWYGGQLLSRHELSVDSYFIIYTAIMFGGQAAGFSFGFSTSLSQSQAAANRFFYLKNSKPKINSTQGSDPRGLRDEDAAAAIVEFRNVHFRYPTRPDVTVLRDFNLQVRRGETVCLVGPSGCGKSTVISLLERFYDPSAGEILIDGAPLPSLDIKRYRAMLALVSQETSLYYGTIRENLLLGVEDGHGGGDAKATAAAQSDEGRMVEACKQASIHDFVASLPDGYATHCGPRGTALSGGQRQRLAIARALLRDPQILLLDEATSSLDAENEQLVREALERAAHGRTTVSATHHAEAMKTADRVVVMEHGRVVEEGSYEDLMAARGPLWRMHCEMELK